MMKLCSSHNHHKFGSFVVEIRGQDVRACHVMRWLTCVSGRYRGRCDGQQRGAAGCHELRVTSHETSATSPRNIPQYTLSAPTSALPFLRYITLHSLPAPTLSVQEPPSPRRCLPRLASPQTVFDHATTHIPQEPPTRLSHNPS